MAINARAISGSDPGAVPGASTKFPSFSGTVLGAKQDRRTCKDDAFARMSSVRSSLNNSCKWQLCWRRTARSL